MKIKRADDIKRITPPEKGNARHPVDGAPGLNLKVTEKDARAWTFRYRPKLGPRAGASREYTIGDYPLFGLGLAKDEYRKLRRRVQQGEDPLQEVVEARSAPTMRDLAERYLADVSARKKSRDHDELKFKRYILPRLGSYKVAGVTFEDCDRLHQSMRAKPVQANRVLTGLKAAFKLAMRLGWRADNPAAYVARFPEQPRERYLTDQEYPRLFEALAKTKHQTAADIVRLLLLTGARRREVTGMRWVDVNLEGRVWSKPTTKTGPHRVPLSAPAAAVIARQPRVSAYVFVTRTGRPFHDPKREWQAIRETAGIDDVRLHDLRHSSASLLASDGESLKIIGQLLGHRDVGSTNRYSHIDLRAARAASDKLGRKLGEYDIPEAEVAPMKGGA